MTEEQKEFRQEMLDDEYQEKADIAHEIKMRNDYDYFISEIQDTHDAAIDAMQELKNKHKMYDHEFLITEFEYELS